jgi:hypothetical protein
MAASKDCNANAPSGRGECTDGRSHCLYEELKRRRAYDAVRASKGLVALYRPPSLR